MGDSEPAYANTDQDWFKRGSRINNGPGRVGNFIDHEEFEYTPAALEIVR